MPPGRLPRKPYAGKEIPISVLEMMSREEMLWISGVALPTENFPPCIKNIIQKTEREKGSHRTAAILAAFLGQAGW
jgi:DNA primase large subunit